MNAGNRRASPRLHNRRIGKLFPYPQFRPSRALCVGPALGNGRDDMSQTHRLAAILTAGVVGYSRPMGVTGGRGRHTLQCLRDRMPPLCRRRRPSPLSATPSGAPGRRRSTCAVAWTAPRRASNSSNSRSHASRRMRSSNGSSPTACRRARRRRRSPCLRRHRRFHRAERTNGAGAALPLDCVAGASLL